MKRRILITGSNSYVGTSFQNWILQWKDLYTVDTLDMKNPNWIKEDFSLYDIIFHVAGIVHKKEKPNMEDLYDKVNGELPFQVAEKAKISGVKQFIFISTMAVYGIEGKVGQELVINRNTTPNPKTLYGKSKLEAETKLSKLADEYFKIIILRPPMIYGPNCPGNYASLVKISRITPIFPMVENKRSMIHINKLCELIMYYIDDNKSGLYLPQNDEYINTSLLVYKLARAQGRKLILSKSLGSLVKVFAKRIGILNKIFGNLTYEKY